MDYWHIEPKEGWPAFMRQYRPKCRLLRLVVAEKDTGESNSGAVPHSHPLHDK
jgi:hypothetical protein